MNVRFADTILGFLLGTVVATILNFFLGSSASSKEKTEVLAAELKEQKR
jgi:ABC-type nitrate/sulfonate/bicarbonate transport system permease component